MTCTVLWKTSAEAALAEIRLRVRHKDSVARAANAIDAELRIDPHLKGRPHLGQTRILFAAPLGVIYRVHEQDRIVRVLAVWWIPAYTTNGSP